MRLILAILAFSFPLLFSEMALAQALPGFKDCSVASLSGSSQSLVVANPQRKYLLMCNTGANNVGVNLAGGTAAIAGAGTITLVPGACKEYSAGTSYLPNPPGNAITVIGTAAQPVACLEGR